MSENKENNNSLSELENDIAKYYTDVTDTKETQVIDCTSEDSADSAKISESNEDFSKNYNFSDDGLGNKESEESFEYENQYVIPDNDDDSIERKNMSGKKMKKVLIISASVFIFLFAAIFTISAATLPKNTVVKNMYVEDINVGGMTYEEALKALEKAFLFNNKKITLSSGEHTFTIDGKDIGIEANPEDTAKKVFEYAKTGNILSDGFSHMVSIIKKKRIEPVATIDMELLNQKINEFGIKIHGEMKGHYVEINEIDNTATVWPGCVGYDPNDPKSYTEAANVIAKSLKKDVYNNIHITLPKTEPQPLTIEKLDALVYADPVNANFKIENNEVTVEEEKNGRYLNKEEAAKYLPNIVIGGEPVKIPFYVSKPDVTKESIEGKLFSSTLASYSTNYGGSTSNRAANVARAAALINGKILAAGEIFSFNGTVGDRTKSNGFFEATEYVNGESVIGIGGGVCQVSTTLYSAALYADLQIVNRTCHAMSVGYVPLGQDATVVYNSIDFKFKNSTEYPVKIVAKTGGGTITVSIIGTTWEPSRKVEVKHVTSSIGEDTSVKSTRYVYSEGKLISTDPLGGSYYKPHKEKTEEKPSPSPEVITSEEVFSNIIPDIVPPIDNTQNTATTTEPVQPETEITTSDDVPAVSVPDTVPGNEASVSENITDDLEVTAPEIVIE